MSKDAPKEVEKLDVLQHLPSNLDVLPRDRILKYAEDMNIRVYSNIKRDDLIKRIRKEHARKRLLAIREREKTERRFISTVMKKDWAKRRLMKDLKEIQSTNLDFVCAMPMKKDLFEWHVNLLSPRSCRYFPMVLHLILTFTDEYPLQPPKCELVTPIHHSHVFDGGKWICLDLLETHGAAKAYHGWSSSYSIISILFQLQSFLFEDDDTKFLYSTMRVKKDILKSTKVSCSCGHNPSQNRIFPTWSYWGEETHKIYFRPELTNGEFRKVKKYSSQLRRKKKKLKKGEEEDDETALLTEEERIERQELYSKIPSEVLIYIFQFLDRRVILRFSKVCKSWRRITLHPFLWQDELRCFHTKNDFREDCLGLGLNVQKKYRKIHQVSTPLDVIGKHAFYDQKIKKSPWNLPFSHWMPLFIDNKHWKRSRSDFEKLVKEIFTNPPREPTVANKKMEKEEEARVLIRHNSSRSNNEEKEESEGEAEEEEQNISSLCEPRHAVDFCCKLMQSMVIEIMKGELHASIKAIQGYAYFYRILIFYVTKYPHLRNEIDYNIGMFIKHEKYRHKRYVPNLGDFICLLSVSRLFSWDDVRDAFIDELFDRNSFWMSKKFDILLAEEQARKGKYKGRNLVSVANSDSKSRSSASTTTNQQRVRRVVVVTKSHYVGEGPKTEAERDRKRRYRARKRRRKAEEKRLQKNDPKKYEELMEQRRNEHELLQRSKLQKNADKEQRKRNQERIELLKTLERRRKEMDKRRKEDEEKRKRNEKMRQNLRVSFQCVEVSLKFTLFHLCFLNTIRKNTELTIEEIGDGYDRRFGSEDRVNESKLQQLIFKVNEMKSFNQFFEDAGYDSIFSSIAHLRQQKGEKEGRKEEVDEEKKSLLLEKLTKSEQNFTRRRYNRRIDTSGSILTGKFERSLDEVKKMIRYKKTRKMRRRRKEEENEGEESSSDESEDEEEKRSRGNRRNWRGRGRRMFRGRGRGRRNVPNNRMRRSRGYGGGGGGYNYRRRYVNRE